MKLIFRYWGKDYTVRRNPDQPKARGEGMTWQKADGETLRRTGGADCPDQAGRASQGKPEGAGVGAVRQAGPGPAARPASGCPALEALSDTANGALTGQERFQMEPISR